jgi:hypothetical protein
VKRRVPALAESVLIAFCTGLGVLTLVDPTWIEAAFAFDPDRGRGDLEVLISLGLLGVALTLSARSVRGRHLRWRRQKG